MDISHLFYPPLPRTKFHQIWNVWYVVFHPVSLADDDLIGAPRFKFNFISNAHSIFCRIYVHNFWHVVFTERSQASIFKVGIDWLIEGQLNGAGLWVYIFRGVLKFGYTRHNGLFCFVGGIGFRHRAVEVSEFVDKAFYGGPVAVVQLDEVSDDGFLSSAAV